MILHDICSIEFYQKTQTPTVSPVEVADVPCELTPITSAETAIGVGTEFVTTDYLFTTTFDVNAYWSDDLGADVRYNALRIKYRGDTLQMKGGLEVHRVLGRFHHLEAIMSDFGRFFSTQ